MLDPSNRMLLKHSGKLTFMKNIYVLYILSEWVWFNSPISCTFYQSG